MQVLFDNINNYSLSNDLFLKFTNKNLDNRKLDEKSFTW